MDNKKNIEKLFEEQFQAYEPDPSVELWSKISRELKWKYFMRPRWDSFNIGYLSAIILATVITALVLNNKNNNADLQEGGNPIFEMEDLGNESKIDTKTSVDNDQSSPNNTSIHKSGSNKIISNQNSRSGRDNKAVLTDKNSDPINQAFISETKTQQLEPRTQNPEPSSQLPTRAFYIPSCDKGCAPLHLTFTNLSSEAVEYIWSFGDGGQSNEMNPEYIFDEPGEYFVTLTAKNENEEISVYHNVISVNEVPKASFMIDKQDGSLKNVSVYLYNYSKGADNYTWDFGDGTQSTEANPTHVFEELSDYDIILKATSAEGCLDTMILTNALNSDNPVIMIPNAFSPNKNGPNGGYYSNGGSNNEVFHPVFENTPVEYQLRIFNRNGNLLFESKELNIGWDGYYMQQLQPRGVYIYKLRVKFENGEYIVKMGDVTVYSID